MGIDERIWMGRRICWVCVFSWGLERGWSGWRCRWRLVGGRVLLRVLVWRMMLCLMIRTLWTLCTDTL